MEEFQSSELLFEVEYRHPWCRPVCCTPWNEYRDIEEVNPEQTDRGQGDENGNHSRSLNYTSEQSDSSSRGRQSPPHRGPGTEMSRLVLND